MPHLNNLLTWHATIKLLKRFTHCILGIPIGYATILFILKQQNFL